MRCSSESEADISNDDNIMDPNYEALMQNLSDDEEQSEEEVILEVN